MSIGAGLHGPSGLKATVYARGIPQMSAFAFDSSGRLWVARSGANTHEGDGVYLVAGAGAQPVKVIPASLKGPLGLVWIGKTLYVSSLGYVTAFSGLAGHHFAQRKTIVTGPVAGIENNNLVEAPDGRLVLGDHRQLRPLHAEVEVGRLDRLVPHRRQLTCASTPAGSARRTASSSSRGRRISSRA